MIFLMATNTKFHIFTDGAKNLYRRVLWYAEFHDVIFIQILWLLGDVSSFLKIRPNFAGS